MLAIQRSSANPERDEIAKHGCGGAAGLLPLRTHELEQALEIEPRQQFQAVLRSSHGSAVPTNQSR
jgi:hypothetical protein